jgi:phosphoenolpyruvate synthase/pyruvate phosphate dikinase
MKAPKGNWFRMEEIPRVHPLMIGGPMNGFTRKKLYGLKKANMNYSVTSFEGTTASLYFIWDEFHTTGKAILEKILKDPKWAENINKKIIRLNQKYFDFAKKNAHTDLGQLSNRQLGALYEQLRDRQFTSHELGVIWVVLEFEHQLYTKYLQDYLEKQTKAMKKDYSVGEIFSVLSTPLDETFAQKEEKDLLKIAQAIQADEKAWKLFIKGKPKDIMEKLPQTNKRIDRQIQKHYENFCWLPFMYMGPAWKKDYFVEVLSKMVTQNPDVTALITKARERQAKIRRDQKKYFKQLKIDKKHQSFFKIAQGMVYTKAFRKDCLYHGCWLLEKIIKEIAKRLHVTLDQAWFFMPWEIKPALIKGQTDADVLNKRKHRLVYIVKNGKPHVLVEQEARDYLLKVIPRPKKIKASKVNELLGDCACPGSARGLVKVINNPGEMRKMKEGNILVAHATNPDIVPAMKKAGAIVTDLGGMTCHAAIVSRELRIPCIVGTKHATKVFKDGEAVHVDATHGRIKKLLQTE